MTPEAEKLAFEAAIDLMAPTDWRIPLSNPVTDYANEPTAAGRWAWHAPARRRSTGCCGATSSSTSSGPCARGCGRRSRATRSEARAAVRLVRDECGSIVAFEGWLAEGDGLGRPNHPRPTRPCAASSATTATTASPTGGHRLEERRTELADEIGEPLPRPENRASRSLSRRCRTSGLRRRCGRPAMRRRPGGPFGSDARMRPAGCWRSS